MRLMTAFVLVLLITFYAMKLLWILEVSINLNYLISYALNKKHEIIDRKKHGCPGDGWCNSRGVCIQSKCHCLHGFFGSECQCM